MLSKKSLLVAATILGSGLAGAAYAQPAQAPAAPQATYDASQLPQVQGKVAQYSLTPRGDVDGLILEDGTQVHFPPHMSAALVYTVRPGDSVTVHGLKAKALPIVMAMSITNDSTHQTVTDPGPGGRDMAAPAADINGQVKAPLYGPRGEVNGALLADGTELRLPPPEAARLGDVLAAGKPVVVQGAAIDGPLGKVVLVRAIGPDAAHLTTIAAPRFGDHGPRHGHHGHKHGPEGAGPGDQGPGGQGPDAPDGAAPPPPPAQ